ncbi:MAG: Zn-finger nucleic acid-binding protein [Haloarculaceae archaeon]
MSDPRSIPVNLYFSGTKGEYLMGVLQSVFDKAIWMGRCFVSPLKRGEGPNKFRLSSDDTATTTYDGDEGWTSRPPAHLACPRCDAEILQHNAMDEIDCPRCVAEFDHNEFTDLDLLYMTCPVCKSQMKHGQRHPEVFDFPEWATCDNCRYHWEFKHSY